MKSTAAVLVLNSLFLGHVFIGCDNARQNQPVTQPTTIQAKDIEVRKTIEEIGQLLSKAVIAKDYETQLKYFSENAVIEPPFGPAVKGKKEIQRGVDQNSTDSVTFHSYNTTIEDLWVCGDKVYDKGKWGMSRTSHGSTTPIAFYGSYFVIWKIQQDGSYLIDYIIYNLDFNPYEGRR
jgi:ketosteroid isomerase-like protein